MLKFYKLMFFTSMIMGTLITISAYSWLSMWMGLEINLLSIIPLLSDKKNIYPAEAALKYFITQAFASSILLLSILINFTFNEFFPLNSLNSQLIMNSALLLKLGAAPFHAWFPEVLEGLNWNMSMVLLTWQKIAPMVLIFYNFKISLFFFTIILFNTMIGGILGLNQISLRKIMAYSSINHIGWMLASMLNSSTIWTVYFLIYTMISFNIILIFKESNSYYLPQFLSSLNYNKTMNFFFLLNFLSLGGLPPFLGFFPKWLVINNLTQANFIFLSISLIVFTLITLFFYLRISFSTMMINSNESLMFLKKLTSVKILTLNFLSVSGLLFCTLSLDLI